MEIYELYDTTSYKKEVIANISRKYKIVIPEDLVQEYLIKDWINIESLSYKLYGTCDFGWILMELNNIVNPFEDWLKTDEEVYEAALKKYGKNINAVHHYEYYQNATSNKKVISKTKPSTGTYISDGFVTVTNIENAYDINEKKRKIFIINPSSIHYVVKLMDELKWQQ